MEDKVRTVQIKCSCGLTHDSKLNLATMMVKVECREYPGGAYLVDWAMSPDRR
jgi:hypothetical protein